MRPFLLRDFFGFHEQVILIDAFSVESTLGDLQCIWCVLLLH